MQSGQFLTMSLCNGANQFNQVWSGLQVNSESHASCVHSVIFLYDVAMTWDLFLFLPACLLCFAFLYIKVVYNKVVIQAYCLFLDRQYTF